MNFIWKEKIIFSEMVWNDCCGLYNTGGLKMVEVVNTNTKCRKLDIANLKKMLASNKRMNEVEDTKVQVYDKVVDCFDKISK